MVLLRESVCEREREMLTVMSVSDRTSELKAATTNADHSGCDMSTGFAHLRIEVCQIVLGMTFMQ